MGWISSLINGTFALGSTALQNGMSKKTARELSEHQFLLNEQSAENALKRKDLWYNQYESPQAMLDQFRKAGLNPAAMLGSITGSQGNSAPQGQGTSTNMANVANIADVFSNLQLAKAQKDLLQSQKEKTEAETEGVQSDNYIKLLEQNLKQIEEKEKTYKHEILYNDYQGKSAYELFQIAENFDEWKKNLINYSDNEDHKTKIYSSTDALRNIYEDFTKTSRNIAFLKNEEIDAELKFKISEELKNSDYTNKSKVKILNEIEQDIQNSQLEGRIKEAWNRFLNYLESVNMDAATILLFEVLKETK